jgi:phage terminase large subunit
MPMSPVYKPYCVYDESGTPIYEPSDKQLLLHQTRAKYTLYGGSRGSGKSYAAIFESIFTCLKIPGCEVVIVRRSFPQLEQSILRQFEKLPHQIYSNDPLAWNHASNFVRFDNGSKLYFRSCQNIDSARQMFKGSQYVLICVDELTEFTLDEFYEMIGGNRCPIKTDINGDPVVSRFIGMTNPGGIGHAFCKALFVDNVQVAGQDVDLYDPSDYKFIKALVTDNPVYALDKAYLKSLESMSPALVAAYRWGDWNVFSGQYFDNFVPTAVLLDEDEILLLMNQQKWQPRWMSIDWGYAHHAVVLWHTTLVKNDVTYYVTYKEFVIKEMGEAALGQEIVRLNKEQKLKHVYLSPECFGDAPHSRAKLIGDVLVANGMNRPIPANNERIDGWRLLYNLLNDRPTCSYQISTACPETFKAIPMLIRNAPLRLEDVKKIDQVEDDIGDCIRYGLMSYIHPRKKPDEVEYQEKLAKITDYTQKNIFSLRYQEKMKRKKKKGFKLR